MSTQCFWVEPTGDPGPDRRWTNGVGEWTDQTLPPGAMLDATWYHDIDGWRGPDGIALMVVLPPQHIRSDNGEVDNRSNWWHADGPSRNNGVPGPGWSRTGDPKASPPTVTIQPSILTGDYHGFVQGGTLTDDIGGHIVSEVI